MPSVTTGMPDISHDARAVGRQRGALSSTSYARMRWPRTMGTWVWCSGQSRGFWL
jgi:hypothetical protein